MTATATDRQFTSRDLTITRVLDMPRALVFEAWTDPRHVAEWWGSQGFTTPVCELDARPGGAPRIVMRAPDAGRTQSLDRLAEHVTHPARRSL